MTHFNLSFFIFFLFSEANFPRFAEPIPNITVTVGRDALLACVVDNLKAYRVSIVKTLIQIKSESDPFKFIHSCTSASDTTN